MEANWIPMWGNVLSQTDPAAEWVVKGKTTRERSTVITIKNYLASVKKPYFQTTTKFSLFIFCVHPVKTKE